MSYSVKTLEGWFSLGLEGLDIGSLYLSCMGLVRPSIYICFMDDDSRSNYAHILYIRIYVMPWRDDEMRGFLYVNDKVQGGLVIHYITSFQAIKSRITRLTGTISLLILMTMDV